MVLIGSSDESRTRFLSTTLQALSVIRDSTCPVDIEAIAQLLNAKIDYSDLLYDGSVEETDDNGYVICVNMNQSHAKQRFTIAHEIGHILLNEEKKKAPSDKGTWKEGPEILSETGYSSNNPIERHCNRIAASILIPEESARKLSDWTRITVSGVEAEAQKWQMSLTALLWRVLALSDRIGGFAWLSKKTDALDGRQEMSVDSVVFPKLFERRGKIRYPIVIPKKHSSVPSHSKLLEASGEETLIRGIIFATGSNQKWTVRIKEISEKDNESKYLAIIYPLGF